jgi:predicted ATPase
MGIYSIRIQNFKSMRDTGEIQIKPLNVLIGPNGAGKSNFISFFKFLNRLYEQQLQIYISRNGRADNFLYFGRKHSEFLGGTITFNNDWKNQYEFAMVADIKGDLIFSKESSNYTEPGTVHPNRVNINIPGRTESVLKDDTGFRNKHLKNEFNSFKIFHFHDTSFNSKVKQPCNTTDYAFLYEDGGNIAAFLYRLKQTHEGQFKMIERVVQSIAPFFESFYLQPDEVNPLQIYLRWKEKGSDQIFTAHNFSDGTLRMICLTTLLLQPNLPDTIIIDEPELGLHPFAINKLAAMLQSASSSSQIIISTQSVNLVNEFSADDIIIVERENEQTVLKRQTKEGLEEWLSDYSLGELWQKNILGGSPK